MLIPQMQSLQAEATVSAKKIALGLAHAGRRLSLIGRDAQNEAAAPQEIFELTGNQQEICDLSDGCKAREYYCAFRGTRSVFVKS